MATYLSGCLARYVCGPYTYILISLLLCYTPDLLEIRIIFSSRSGSAFVARINQFLKYNISCFWCKPPLFPASRTGKKPHIYCCTYQPQQLGRAYACLDGTRTSCFIKCGRANGMRGGVPLVVTFKNWPRDSVHGRGCTFGITGGIVTLEKPTTVHVRCGFSCCCW